MVIFCANWLDSEIYEHTSSASIHNYWAHRLNPLIHSDCIFVACNRIGTEKGMREQKKTKEKGRREKEEKG